MEAAKSISLLQAKTGIPMELICDSRIDGNFEGWDEGRIYTLLNGTSWEQDESIIKKAHAYCPRARVWRDGARRYLEVEGMGETIRVIPAGSSLPEAT
jgi:hypothetical protein